MFLVSHLVFLGKDGRTPQSAFLVPFLKRKSLSCASSCGCWEGHPCSAKTYIWPPLMAWARSLPQRETAATRHASFNGNSEHYRLQPFGCWSQNDSPTTGMQHVISASRLSDVNG